LAMQFGHSLRLAGHGLILAILSWPKLIRPTDDIDLGDGEALPWQVCSLPVLLWFCTRVSVHPSVAAHVKGLEAAAGRDTSEWQRSRIERGTEEER